MERKCVKWWEFLVFWRIMAKNQLFRFIVRKTQQWYCTFYFLRKFHLPNVHLANYTISEFEMPKSLTDDIKLRTYQIWRIIYKWRTVKLRILTKVFLRRKWTLDTFQIVLLLQEFFSWFVCKNSEIMKFFRNQMLHALYLSWTWDLKLRTPGLCHQGDNHNSHNHLYNGWWCRHRTSPTLEFVSAFGAICVFSVISCCHFRSHHYRHSSHHHNQSSFESCVYFRHHLSTNGKWLKIHAFELSIFLIDNHHVSEIVMKWSFHWKKYWNKYH